MRLHGWRRADFQPLKFKYKFKVTKNILFCWLIKNNLLALHLIWWRHCNPVLHTGDVLAQEQ